MRIQDGVTAKLGMLAAGKSQDSSASVSGDSSREILLHTLLAIVTCHDSPVADRPSPILKNTCIKGEKY
jgi:hypothetical protein